MELAAVCSAIESGKRIEFSYHGQLRIVEAHTAGHSKDNRQIMRAWQVRGGSVSGSRTPWRIFHLDEISNADIIDEKSEAPRPGYRRGDPAIFRIVCEI